MTCESRDPLTFLYALSLGQTSLVDDKIFVKLNIGIHLAQGQPRRSASLAVDSQSGIAADTTPMLGGLTNMAVYNFHCVSRTESVPLLALLCLQ